MESETIKETVSDSDIELAQQREWVIRTKHGDHTAFTLLVRAYQDVIYRFCLRFMGNGDIAQDITQDTFYRLYKTIDRFDETRRIRPWLYQIAANLCKDYLKRKEHQRMVSWSEEIGTSDPHETSPSIAGRPDVVVALRQDADRMMRAVSALPETYREALLLKVVEGLNYEEAAVAAGATVTTMKIRVVRARLRLHEILGAEHAASLRLEKRKP